MWGILDFTICKGKGRLEGAAQEITYEKLTLPNIVLKICVGRRPSTFFTRVRCSALE